jgi:dimethylargininase
MPEKIAIVRRISPALNDCELTFVDRETIDFGLADRQHRNYVRALTEAGCEVVELAADERLADSAFVEDCAVVLDEVAVIARPGTESRRPEVGAVEQVIHGYRSVIERVEAPGTLEGGDVLRVGRRLFVGLSTRTNEAGFSQFAGIVARFGYEAIPVRVFGSLHLKTAVTALDGETVLLNPDWIDATHFNALKPIPVPKAEPFAANTLTIEGVVHVSKKWPATRRLIDGAEFRTRVIDISELEKAEAGLTCLSLLFGLQKS